MPLFEIGVVGEVFGMPRPDMLARPYAVQVCTVGPGPVRTQGAQLTITGDGGLDAPAAVTALRATSVRLGGSTVVLDAPAATKTTLDTWGEVPALDLMRRVRNEFDPRRTLAPGRFVGDL